MESVVLPPPLDRSYAEVEKMWESFVQAEEEEAHAGSIIDAELKMLAD
jgi:hypothetical protein